MGTTLDVGRTYLGHGVVYRVFLCYCITPKRRWFYKPLDCESMPQTKKVLNPFLLEARALALDWVCMTLSSSFHGRVVGGIPGRRPCGTSCTRLGSFQSDRDIPFTSNRRYCARPVELLGRGGMAETFKAYDADLDRYVAIKRLTLKSMSSWKALELFEREAATLKELAHTSIPAYLDYFEEDSADGTDAFFFLVQELASGMSLQALVQSGRRFSDAELKHILESVLETIVYLSALRPGVVHRDIKPSNIIAEDPDDVCRSRVVLVDFGGVTNAAGTANDEARFSTMTIVGTPAFMAPEQYRGRRATHLSDVYSLAATLLFIATRRMPSEFPERRMRIDLSALELDATLKSLLQRMLEPAVEDRIDAVRALAVLRADMRKPTGSVGGNRWSDRAGFGIPDQGISAAVDATLYTARNLGKPIGSRVDFNEADGALVITIPPARWDGAAASVGGFAIAWNSFVAFWTFSAVASGGIIFGLFSLPFWIAGYGMAKTALARQFVTEELYMDAVSWRLTKRVALLGKDNVRDFDGGASKQRVGFVQDLGTSRVAVRGYVNDVPQTDVSMKHGVEEIVLGEGLDEVEQAFIAEKINEWLSRYR